MTEKEAIDILNELSTFDYVKLENGDQAIEIVLNLIEKPKDQIEYIENEYGRTIEEKDKEITKLKNNNKDLLRKLRNRIKEVKKLEKYSLYKKEFSTLNQQLEKKDRQLEEKTNRIRNLEKECQKHFDNMMDTIRENSKKDKIMDLMAEFMNKRSWKEHQVKDDNCYCCKIEYGSDECKDCIKQYFERKIEEE